MTAVGVEQSKSHVAGDQLTSLAKISNIGTRVKILIYDTRRYSAFTKFHRAYGVVLDISSPATTAHNRNY